MRRGRIFILLAVILMLVLIVVYVAMSGMLSPEPVVTQVVDITPLPTPTPQTVEIVIAVQSVARGDVIREGHVNMTPIPESEFDENLYFTSTDQVIGMKSIVNVEPGLPIMKNSVTETGGVESAGSVWALEIPPGYVAVSIPINRLSAVSYALQRGDRVSVISTMLLVELDVDFQSRLPNMSAQILGPILTEQENMIGAVASQTNVPMGRGELELAFEQTFYSVPSESQRPRLVSQTLIQDVIVLYMGTFPQEEQELPSPVRTAPTRGEAEETPTPTPVAAPQPNATPVPTVTPPPPPDVITLIVRPQDAVVLNYLVFSGAQLTLALQGPTLEGQDLADTQAVTLQYLLENYNIPVPVKLPYGIEPRIDVLVPQELINDLVIEETEE